MSGVQPATPTARALRGDVAAVALAGAVAGVGITEPAQAFVYGGTEYFDIFFGIDPLWWGVTAFGVVYCAATLKNAVAKYQVTKIGLPPPKTSPFVGKEVENKEISYKAK